MPTLTDGDFVLTESRAIMQYLASKKPESGLLPHDERGRVDVTRWQFWGSSHFLAAGWHVGLSAHAEANVRMGEPDAAKIEEALVNLCRYAAVLNQHLEGKTYVIGNALTLADLTRASSLIYAKQVDVPLVEFRHIQSCLNRITELEA